MLSVLDRGASCVIERFVGLDLLVDQRSQILDHHTASRIGDLCSVLGGFFLLVGVDQFEPLRRARLVLVKGRSRPALRSRRAAAAATTGSLACSRLPRVLIASKALAFFLHQGLALCAQSRKLREHPPYVFALVQRIVQVGVVTPARPAIVASVAAIRARIAANACRASRKSRGASSSAPAAASALNSAPSAVDQASSEDGTAHAGGSRNAEHVMEKGENQIPARLARVTPTAGDGRRSVRCGRENGFQRRSGQHGVAPGLEFALGGVRQTFDHHRRQRPKAALE